MKQLPELCNITTGKLDANAAVENGIYPYFTCGEEPAKINEYAFDCDAILIAGNNAQGNFHVSRYNGKFNAYQRTYVLTAKENCNLDFVYYSLKLSLEQLRTRSQGSQTKFLTMPILNAISINDALNQKKIADVLSCIDDKIALNNKTNTELENMAKTIYDYWFTQFDFPDNNGHPYKTSGGHMVYNEILKREIPAEWEVGKLGFYLENFGDGIHGTPEYDDSGEYYFINGNNLGNKLISFTSDPSRINDEEYKKIQRPLNENTILLSINGTLGSISFYNGEKIAIGKSACFLNIKEKEVKPFIYQILCSEKFQKYMYTVASGSTIKNFAPKQAADFDIPIPPKDLLEQFYNTTYSYLENQIKNEKENEELIKLRDYLLPLLMNGQIEVK